ncbi:MAG: leucine-rich repeat protein, partial [Mariniphaga sp.]
MATGSFRHPLQASSNEPFLQLTFDTIDNADLMVGDSADVSDWNTFFDLPAYGTPYTRVLILGRTVMLYGGKNITIRPSLMVDYLQQPILEKVIDKGSIIKLEDGAFYNCTGLTDVFLSDCTEITNNPGSFNGTFAGCSALLHVTMPSLLTLGSKAFENNTEILTFDLPVLETAYDNCFYGCTSVLSFSCTQLVSAGANCFYNCMSASFDLPLLESAGNACFSGCLMAYTIDFPLLTSAGTDCFNACRNTTTLTLPSLISAGDACFSSCNSVQEYNLTSLESAGDGCFAHWWAVTGFELPALISAGQNCFTDCWAVTIFELPLLETIGDSCFNGCQSAISFNLPSVITLGSGVSTGFDNVFNGITGLNISLTVNSALMICNEGDPDDDIQYLLDNNTVTISPHLIPLKLFFDDIDNADLLVGDSTDVGDWNTFFGLPVNGTAFTSLIISGNIVKLYGGGGISIIPSLFEGEDSILKVIDSAHSIISIGDSAFANCDYLNEVSFPVCTETIYDHVTGSGYGNFYDCTRLVTVNFPALTTIGKNSFMRCTGLTDSAFMAQLTAIGDHGFEQCTALINPDFSSLVTAGENGFAACIGLVNPDFSALTTAGNYCYTDCAGLINPDFSSLQTAAEGCFWACISLDSDFSALTSTGTNCFNGCIGLTSPDFSSLQTAADRSFVDCAGLIDPDFTSLRTAGSQCFYNCTGLTSDFSALTTAG